MALPFEPSTARSGTRRPDPPVAAGIPIPNALVTIPGAAMDVVSSSSSRRRTSASPRSSAAAACCRPWRRQMPPLFCFLSSRRDAS